MAYAIAREPDDVIEPDVTDFETACAMMADIEGREAWSLPRTLAQWVAKIREYERQCSHAKD